MQVSNRRAVCIGAKGFHCWVDAGGERWGLVFSGRSVALPSLGEPCISSPHPRDFARSAAFRFLPISHRHALDVFTNELSYVNPPKSGPIMFQRNVFLLCLLLLCQSCLMLSRARGRCRHRCESILLPRMASAVKGIQRLLLPVLVEILPLYWF